jgi:signal transduction histidine kinase
MTRAIRRRIFEPFFTTKETTGTGLGLWVSSEIITKHSATVRVASRPAEAAGTSQSGTVFMVFFPEDGIGVAPRASAGEIAQDASSEDRPREPHEVR